MIFVEILKKIACWVLVLMLIVSLVPVDQAQAVGQGDIELGHSETAQIDRSFTDTSVGPTLADGNHEKWIDRIADLPDYAAELYQWLEDNSSDGGALIDPTKGLLVDDGYYYLIDTVTNSVTYSYTDDKQTAAQEAVVAHADSVFDVIMDYSVDTYSAFDRDHPEVFWLSGGSSYTWKLSYSYGGSNGVGTATYTMNVYFYLQADGFDIRDSRYQDAAVLDAAIAQRDSDVERILAECPVDAPVDEQLRYLNRVLTESNCYNSSAVAQEGSMDPWKCVSALRGGVGSEGPVCEGYSRALKVLCDRLEIPCVLVEGYARSGLADASGAHMWNYVQVDGQWYAVDVTWNDPVSSSAGDVPVSGYECEDWFLLGGDTEIDTGMTFLQSHVVENVVTYGGLDFANGPVLAADAYVRPENYMDISSYRSADGHTAPVKEGFVFAGWYADPELTVPLEENAVSGWAYAKFVDEKVLSVKYQITKGTTADSASTNLRLLTSVDGLDYSDVSFTMSFGSITESYVSRTVYSAIIADGVVIRNANEIFDGSSKYFMTHTLTGVPQSAFDEVITVVPCWTTLDGTFVQGMAREIVISDGF